MRIGNRGSKLLFRIQVKLLCRLLCSLSMSTLGLSGARRLLFGRAETVKFERDITSCAAIPGVGQVWPLKLSRVRVVSALVSQGICHCREFAKRTGIDVADADPHFRQATGTDATCVFTEKDGCSCDQTQYCVSVNNINAYLFPYRPWSRVHPKSFPRSHHSTGSRLPGRPSDKDARRRGRLAKAPHHR